MIIQKNLRELKKILSEVSLKAKKTRKKSAIVITTTAKKSVDDLIILPVRETIDVICGAVTIYNIRTAVRIVKEIDGKVDYIIIDAEQKVNGLENLLKLVSCHISKSKILTFKSNDITVDSTDAIIAKLLCNNFDKKIAIIGAGNIGSKLALKLVERGVNVFVARRKIENASKLANALNFIKFKHSIARVIPKSLSTIAKNADMLIGFTAGIPVINSKMISQMKKGGIIIDGGVGTIYKDAILAAQKKKIKILRVDIRSGFAATIRLLLETEELLGKTFGRNKLRGIHVVAGGFYGRYGEIILDRITRPTKIIGIADGNGGVLRGRLSPDLKYKIKIIENLIKRNRR